MGKRLPDTVEGIRAHFDRRYRDKLTVRELATIRENLFNETEYAFVEDSSHRGAAWCSHCRSDIRFDSTYHHEIVICPHCKETLLVKHVWRGIKHVRDEGMIYLYRRSVKAPDIVTALAVSVIRSWGDGCSQGKMPREQQEEIRIDSYSIFVPGEGSRMARPLGGSKIYYFDYYFWDRGRLEGADRYEVVAKAGPRTRTYEQNGYCYDPWYVPAGAAYREPRSKRRERCNWAGLKIWADFQGLGKAAEKSPLRYALLAYGTYQREACLRFMHWAARWPAVEMVLKMGCKTIVQEKMAERGFGWTARCINWRGKNIRSIFRKSLTKADKAYMLHNDVSAATIKFWQGHDWPLEKADMLQRHCICRGWGSIEGYIDIKKALLWLERKGWLDKCGTYRDYIMDCVKLDMDLTDKSVLHPKDIDQAHANTIKQIEYQKNMKYEAAYQKRRRKLIKAYSFAAMGLAIMVPEHVNDLIDEGKAMHNCVGGYVARVADGEADVVFIRHQNNMASSYITMEIRQGYIVQARTQNNGPLDELGQKFVEAFRVNKLEKNRRRTA